MPKIRRCEACFSVLCIDDAFSVPAFHSIRLQATDPSPTKSETAKLRFATRSLVCMSTTIRGSLLRCLRMALLITLPVQQSN